MERSTAEVMKAAREKIAKPEAWTKGALARDATGHAVGYNNPAAICWCSQGATRAAGGKSGEGVSDAIRLLETAANTWDVADFNDDSATTHADVLAMFDKAIALAEQEQA